MKKPLAYVILGATGSGRRELVADIVEGGLEKDERAVVLLSENEAASAADEMLAKSASVARWSRQDAAIGAEIPGGATHIFFITDGRANPVDQVEALRPWLAAMGAELARVLCVVNCNLASKNPALLAWYDACVHFSDMVFLARREGVENKWLSDFQARYKARHAPALFELVKNNRVKNPALALLPQARRLSHYFDEDEWGGGALDDGIEFGTDDGGGGELSEKKQGQKSAGENDEWKPETDPYLERLTPARRAKEIPDIAKYLAPAS